MIYLSPSYSIEFPFHAVDDLQDSFYKTKILLADAVHDEMNFVLRKSRLGSKTEGNIKTKCSVEVYSRVGKEKETLRWTMESEELCNLILFFLNSQWLNWFWFLKWSFVLLTKSYCSFLWTSFYHKFVLFLFYWFMIPFRFF